MGVNITFGIIVLNGEPFTRYCIRALYPFAYEIIIAEGACEGARNIATKKGHSKDGTLEILKEIKRLEDPENKITIVTAEDEGHNDGFWPGEKLEQSRAYAKRAKGNYLWQVDIDEFYKDEDIRKIIGLLKDDKSISCISFNQIGFWGGFNYTVDSWYFKRHLTEIYRIFKWAEGYELKSHRPPTVIDTEKTDVRAGKWLNAKDMKKRGIFMYHYSFVFPKQVFTKADYYSNSNWLSLKANDWATVNFMKITKPFRVFIIPDYPSWLVKFKGIHPTAVQQLIGSINEKETIIEERATGDIEKLINNRAYQFFSHLLAGLEPVDRFMQFGYKRSKNVIRRMKHALGSL
jgi:hypothetical protein